MQKKIVALAVAGLSTAAFAQTNVTIYGVADVSGQGFNQSSVKAANAAANGYNGGNTFNLQSNSSLMGFKGTEDLGNGLTAMFQAETELALTGNASAAGPQYATTSNLFKNIRDTYVGVNSKYGTVMGGYISTPMRSSLTSFDVMPGATGSSQIDKQMTAMRFGAPLTGTQFQTAVRATAIAYAMPTLYGFNGSIAYTGSANNGTTNSTAPASCASATNDLSACTIAPQSALSMNLGWTGYGVNVQGAFQQHNNNLTPVAGNNIGNYGDYTSYLIGAAYTGVAGLKLSTVYVRNTLGTNGVTAVTANGAGKITNNQLFAGASYRVGNWEPRVSATWSSDMDGSSIQQLGSRQWTANVGYYLSKRTQVYGLVSNLNNSANQTFTFGQQQSNLGGNATSGSNLFTYGMGMRTTF